MSEPALPVVGVVAKATKNLLQSSLGVLIAVGFFANMAAQYFVVVPAENKETLIQLSATLVNVFLLLVGYFFGSSTGSAAKGEQVAALAAAAPLVRVEPSATGAPLATLAVVPLPLVPPQP